MSLPINLPQRANIQGFWKLDEEAGVRADESGNGNTLQDNNTVLFDTGQIGNAAAFVRAQEEFLSITDALQTGLDITGELTIAFWLYLVSLPSETSTMFPISKLHVGTNKLSYAVGLPITDVVKFYLSSDGSFPGTEATGTASLVKTTWLHIAVTLNQTTDLMQIYRGGAPDGNAVAYAVNIYDGDTPFIIGNIADGGFNIDGLTDESIVWNKCLTIEEILAVKNISKYNYGTGNFAIFLSEAYRKGKEYFKKKGLYLPDDRLYKPEILIPEGI